MLALTNPNEIIFDPFAGVGSALVAAVIHGRRAVGVDKERVYVDMALDRVNKLIRGQLRYRQLGTRKFVPSGREKASQKPVEWLGK